MADEPNLKLDEQPLETPIAERGVGEVVGKKPRANRKKDYVPTKEESIVGDILNKNIELTQKQRNEVKSELAIQYAKTMTKFFSDRYSDPVTKELDIKREKLKEINTRLKVLNSTNFYPKPGQESTFIRPEVIAEELQKEAVQLDYDLSHYILSNKLAEKFTKFEKVYGKRPEEVKFESDATKDYYGMNLPKENSVEQQDAKLLLNLKDAVDLYHFTDSEASASEIPKWLMEGALGIDLEKEARQKWGLFFADVNSKQSKIFTDADKEDVKTLQSHLDIGEQNRLEKFTFGHQVAKGVFSTIGALPAYIFGLEAVRLNIFKGFSNQFFKSIALAPFTTGIVNFVPQTMEHIRDAENLQDILFAPLKTYWSNFAETLGETATPVVGHFLPHISQSVSKALGKVGTRIGNSIDRLVLQPPLEIFEDEVTNLVNGDPSVFTGSFDTKRLLLSAVTSYISGFGFAGFKTLMSNKYLNSIQKLSESTGTPFSKDELVKMSEGQLNQIAKNLGIKHSLDENLKRLVPEVEKIFNKINRSEEWKNFLGAKSKEFNNLLQNELKLALGENAVQNIKKTEELLPEYFFSKKLNPLFDDTPKENQKSNDLKVKYKDSNNLIYQGDSSNLFTNLEDNEIDLTFTEPPKNLSEGDSKKLLSGLKRNSKVVSLIVSENKSNYINHISPDFEVKIPNSNKTLIVYGNLSKKQKENLEDSITFLSKVPKTKSEIRVNTNLISSLLSKDIKTIYNPFLRKDDYSPLIANKFRLNFIGGNTDSKEIQDSIQHLEFFGKNSVLNKNLIDFNVIKNNLPTPYKDLTSKLESLNFKLTGSLAYAKEGTIYRGENPTHDLDFQVESKHILKQLKELGIIDANENEVKYTDLTKFVHQVISPDWKQLRSNTIGNLQEGSETYSYIYKSLVNNYILTFDIFVIDSKNDLSVTQLGFSSKLKYAENNENRMFKDYIDFFNYKYFDENKIFYSKGNVEKTGQPITSYEGKTIKEVSDYFINHPEVSQPIKNLLQAFQNRGIDNEILKETNENQGSFNLKTGIVSISNQLGINDTAIALSHELLHKLTLKGLISSGKYFDAKLYDAKFAKNIQDLFNEVKSKIGDTIEWNEVTGNDALHPIAQLGEFITYGLTNQAFRNELAKIPYKNTGKTAWRQFIESVWNFLKDKLGITDKQFGQSALTELIQQTTSYIDKAYPIQTIINQQKSELKEKLRLAKEKELLRKEVGLTNNASEQQPSVNETNAKEDSVRDEDEKSKALRNMSVSELTKEFVDKSGNRIWLSAEHMLADMQNLLENKTESEALTEFVNKYSEQIDNLEAKNREQVKLNGRTYLQHIFAQAKGKSYHEVYTLDIDGKLTKHTKTYPTGKGGQSSVIYDKRFYEYVSEQVNKFYGTNIKLFEVKNFKDNLKPVSAQFDEKKKQQIGWIETLYKAGVENNTQSIKNGYNTLLSLEKDWNVKIIPEQVENIADFTYYVKDDGENFINQLLTNLESITAKDYIYNNIFKEGFITIENGRDTVLVNKNFLTEEELKGKTISEISSTAFFKYWEMVFNANTKEGEQIDQFTLIKRVTALSGVAPNTLITPAIRKYLEKYTKQSGAPIYIQDEQVIVKTVQLDMEQLPAGLVKAMKEEWGEYYKENIIGDGAIFSLPIVHNTFNLLNGNDFSKWGVSNKYKTFIIGQQLLKAADQQTYEHSPMHKWMEKHNIGKVILTSARKIKYGKNADSSNSTTQEDIMTGEKPKYIYEYDMRQDADQSSHGEVKTETKGLMPSWITTMLTSFMDKNQLLDLRNHFKSHINYLRTNTLDNLDSSDYIAKDILRFMEQSPDLFESITQQFLQKELVNNPTLAAAYIVAIDYYKQNVLNKKLQDTLQHKEQNGSYTTLIADMGHLTAYQEFFIKQQEKQGLTREEAETLSKNYFNEWGFIKQGFVIQDEITGKLLGKNNKLIISANPPSSFADIRACKNIALLPTKKFTQNIEGFAINEVIAKSAMVSNVFDWQLITGKDFDIDKLPSIPVLTPETEQLWNFIDSLKGTQKLQDLLDKFKSREYTFNDPDVVIAENDINEVKSEVGFKVKGFDEALFRVIKLFGYNENLQNFNPKKNAKQFMQLVGLMSDNYIGRLYNVRMFYTMMLEKGGSVEYTMGNQQYKIETNKKAINRNTALLYYLTNYTLDWQSDQKLLTFNYDVNRLNDILYTIYIKTSKGWSKIPNVDDKGISRVQAIWDTYVKPSRLLFRRPEIESENYKKYAELKQQMLDSYNSLYRLLPKFAAKDHPFDDTTVINTTRDFFNSYFDSPIVNIGLQESDIRRILNEVNKSLLPLKGSNLDKLEESLLQPGQNLDYVGKLLNRYRDLASYTLQYANETGKYGQEDDVNNKGAIKEMLYYADILRQRGEFPELHYLFPVLFKDMLSEQREMMRKQRVYADVIFGEDLVTQQVGMKYKIKYDGEKLRFFSQAWTGRGNRRKLQPEVEHESFDAMSEFGRKEGYSTAKALAKINNEQLTNLTNMFVFKDNKLLQKYLGEKIAEIYAKVGESESLLKMSKDAQRLFFKLGLGIYDNDNESDVGLGKRYRLSFYQRSDSVTYPSGRMNEYGKPLEGNIWHHNLAPYFVYLHYVTENTFNLNAKDLYEEIIHKYTSLSNQIFKEKQDKAKNNELLPIYFFSKANANTVLDSKDESKGLSSYQKEIDELAQEIAKENYFKPFQIVQFWNDNNRDSKINQSQIEAKHTNYYTKHLAEAYFNYKISFEKDRPDKSYQTTKQAFKDLKSLLSDSRTKWNKLTQGIVRSLPAQTLIRRFSKRNILMQPNEKIIFVHNGKDRTLYSWEILRSFGLNAFEDKPNKVSGAMIAQEIMRRVEYAHTDNAHIYKNIAEDTYKVLGQNNKYNPYTQSINDLSAWRGYNFEATAFDISEGKDKNKLLSGIKVDNLDGSIKYKSNVVKVATLQDRKITWNHKELTDLAVQIIKDKKAEYTDGTFAEHNNLNALQVQQVIFGLMQRYIYDFYTEQILTSHIKDLNYMWKYVSRYSEETSWAAKTLINKYSLQAQEKMRQIETTRNKLASKGLFYMPHMFISEKMYKGALVKHFIKLGKTEIQANKLAESEIEKKRKESTFLGTVKETMHVNFLERKLLDLEDILKLPTVTEIYLTNLNAMFRSEIMTAYERIYPEFLQYDNAFMKNQVMWQSSNVKSQNAMWRPLENLNQLSKRNFVSLDWINPEETEHGENFVGEVVSVDIKNNSVRVQIGTTDEGTPIIKTFKKHEVRNISLLTGTLTSKQFSMWYYRLFGKNLENSPLKPSYINTMFKFLVDRRNEAMLGIKFWYSFRNHFGSKFQRRSIFGTKYKQKAKELLNNFKNPEYKPTKTEQQIFDMIKDEAVAIFGEVDAIMGRFGMDLESTKGELNKEYIELINKLNLEWKPISAELKPLYNHIVGIKSQVGLELSVTDALPKFLKYIFVDGAFKEFIYKRGRLYNPTAWMFGENERTNASLGEKNNRILTLMSGIAAFNSLLNTSGLTEQEQKLMNDIIVRTVISSGTQGITLVDFKYQKGLDLSYYDSTIIGRFFLQFSHFGNSLTNTYIDRWVNIAEQYRRFGASKVLFDRELEYTFRYLDVSTGQVVEKQFKQFNELHRALNMTWKSMFLGSIKSLTQVFGNVLIGAIAGGVIWDLWKLIALNSVGDSITVSLVDAFVQSIAWITQSMIDTTPDNGDEDKVAFTVPLIDKDISETTTKKSLATLFGENEDEYVASQRKRINKELPDNLQAAITDDMLREDFRRRTASDIWKLNPTSGVGLTQVYDLLMSLAISHGEFNNKMEYLQSVATTQIPGMSLTIPAIQTIKPDFWSRFNVSQSKFYELKAEAKEQSKKEKIDKLAKNEQEDARLQFLTQDTEQHFDSKKSLDKAVDQSKFINMTSDEVIEHEKAVNEKQKADSRLRETPQERVESLKEIMNKLEKVLSKKDFDKVKERLQELKFNNTAPKEQQY